MDMIKELGKKIFPEITNENWEEVIKIYKENPDYFIFPISISRDTVFHMAMHAKKKKPFVDLHKLFKESSLSKEIIFTRNGYGNTILHEAAAVGKLEAVNILVRDYRELIEVENDVGENPFFTAAARGKTEIVEFFIERYTDGIIKKSRTRFIDEKSVLQVAIEAEQFETALLLLSLDNELAISRDRYGMTALHCLANSPSSFKSGYSMTISETFIYYCLPTQDDSNIEKQDLENGMTSAHGHADSRLGISHVQKELEGINQLIRKWKFLGTLLVYLSLVCPFVGLLREVKRIWKAKTKHEFALKLAKRLIKLNMENPQNLSDGKLNMSGVPSASMSLFIAAKMGIEEIVREAIHEYPQGIELENEKGQNILHIAVSHRRRNIFFMLRKLRMQWRRMTEAIDPNGYTLLHHVASNDNYSRNGSTKPGPAFQLQEELRWFDRVKKSVPSHYVMHKAGFNDEKKEKGQVTPEELFEITHKKQLNDAREWTKNTSTSCSTVAVLVAGVVYAAAYTVPGGSNEKGFPVFLKSPIYTFFTVMNVISLALSLTSVVAFLSILTSPLGFHDFRRSIPRKLTFGFILLFLSLITTMLAFGATILLAIHSEKRWTTSLISIAAFLPVSVFAFLQRGLYMAFVIEMYPTIKKLFPCLRSLVNYSKGNQT